MPVRSKANTKTYNYAKDSAERANQDKKQITQKEVLDNAKHITIVRTVVIED